MGLHQDILNQPVSALELRDVILMDRKDTVRDALSRMRAKKLGCVVAVDDQGKPLGKFTERLLVRLLLNHPDVLDHAVGDHLADHWDCVKRTDPITNLIEVMKTKKLRFVVVLDEQGLPVSLTGQKGVMEYIVDHFPRPVLVQRMTSEFFTDQREGG